MEEPTCILEHIPQPLDVRLGLVEGRRSCSSKKNDVTTVSDVQTQRGV